MKIEEAHLCAECGEIVHQDEGICPDCLSSQFLVMRSLIDAAHRQWLRERIRRREYQKVGAGS